METYYRINDDPAKAVSVDGQPYIMSESANNTLEYWSVDWAGNEELPHKTLTGIKLDMTPPSGYILINENATYTNSSYVTLTISAVDAASGVAQMRFSNDNITWASWETYNTSKAWTLTSDYGIKNVYAQFTDVIGLVSKTDTDSIILDTTPPSTRPATRTPEGDVQPDQEVKVSVFVSDLMSHINSVTLSYNLNDSAVWVDQPMSFNATTIRYEATIPGQPTNTLVEYKIVAYDNAGNCAVENNGGLYYVYTVVIPEFPSAIILPLFAIATLLVVLFCRKRWHLFWRARLS